MKRQPKPQQSHRWFRVRYRLHCALGEHEVAPGICVRMRIGDHRRLFSCEDCLRKVGIERPGAKYRKTSGSESATHSWFIWSQRHGLASPWRRPLETVTIEECVRHAQAAGEYVGSIAGGHEWLKHGTR